MFNLDRKATAAMQRLPSIRRRHVGTGSVRDRRGGSNEAAGVLIEHGARKVYPLLHGRIAGPAGGGGFGKQTDRILLQEVSGHPSNPWAVGVCRIVEHEGTVDMSVDGMLKRRDICAAHSRGRAVEDDAEGVNDGVGLLARDDGVVTVINDVDIAR
jgi:hypothetical protein